MTISVWEAAAAPLGQMIEQERRRNAALQAEIDRLREALGHARTCFRNIVDSHVPPSRAWAWERCMEIEAALAKEVGR